MDNMEGGEAVMEVFPKPVLNLPEADIPLEGITAYLSQGDNHQIIFMKFQKDVYFPAHAHEAQWGVVLEGKIEIVMNGEIKEYTRGDRYFIPKGVEHHGKIYAGYAEITYFDQKDRYKPKVK